MIAPAAQLSSISSETGPSATQTVSLFVYGPLPSSQCRLAVTCLIAPRAPLDCAEGALLDGVPVVPLGETLDGIFFPLLASLPDGCSLGAIPDCAAPFECKATGEWAVDEAAADAEAPAAASGAT